MQGLDYDAPYLALDVLTLLIEKGRLQGRVLKSDEIPGAHRRDDEGDSTRTRSSITGK